MLAKAQHYVPQFYLKNFALERKGKYYTYCYSKKDRKVFRSNIKNLGNEIGFYNFNFQGHIITADPSLSKIENVGKSVLEKLIRKGKIKSINNFEKRRVAEYLGLQMTRTPETEIVSRQMIEGMKKKIGRALEHEKLNKDKEKKHLIRMMMLGVKDFSAALLIHRWALLKNNTNKLLWTSDNPAYRHNELPESFYGNLGFLSPGIQIIFPITPRLLLFIYDKKAYPGIKDYHELSEDNVDYYNCGQIINSIRQIYSESSDFDLANKYLKEYPEVSDENRLRVRTS